MGKPNRLGLSAQEPVRAAAMPKRLLPHTACREFCSRRRVEWAAFQACGTIRRIVMLMVT